MKRIGRFYFGWGKLEQEPRFLPEMIVCPDEKQAQKVRHKIGDVPNIRVVSPCISQLMGPPPAKVTVMPGVDMERDIGGEGCLRGILRKRQLVWGNRAVLFEL